MKTCTIELPGEVSDQTLFTFLRLYQLETWIREMVYLELKAYYGMDWWIEAEGALKRARVPTGSSEKSRSRDKQHPHISTPENDPLWFISFDSLLKIVFDGKLWKLFASFFTTKKLLRAKFEEITPTRNRIAHCRSLHVYDLRRLEQLMRDFDQSFWRFCTSYNDRYYFADDLSKNEVFHHFEEEKRSDIDLFYAVRPFTRSRKQKPELGKGAIYDITIVSRHMSRYMEYDRILKYTRSAHRYVLHIILDCFQNSLRITIPSTVTPSNVIEVIEKFADGCHNCYSVVPLVPRPAGGDTSKPIDFLREHEERLRPFQKIASDWPHYVIPPSHPYSFLDRECPCSFFGLSEN